jgi:hypothetical protein
MGCGDLHQWDNKDQGHGMRIRAQQAALMCNMLERLFGSHVTQNNLATIFRESAATTAPKKVGMRLITGLGGPQEKGTKAMRRKQKNSRARVNRVARQPAEVVGDIRKTARGDDTKEPKEAHDGNVNKDGEDNALRRDVEKHDKSVLLEAGTEWSVLS